MIKFLLIFAIGVTVGAGGCWYLQQARTKSRFAEAKDRVLYTAWKAGKSLKEFTDEIKEELSRSGQVVREKAKAATSAVGDTATTTTLKAKLLAESGLRGVGVETTSGVVTLTGDAASHEDIARAMKIALDTDGVQKVVSKIQVSAAK